MHFPLPLRDFRFMTPEELSTFNVVSQVTERTGPGYVLLVTLDYPPELHVSHNAFPLAPEHVTLTEKDLSPYAQQCWSEFGRTPTGKMRRYQTKKLSATFRRRERYWVHGLCLQFYLEKGLKLVELHAGITFHQEPFLAPYIELCMRRRAASKTAAENKRWKYLSNSLYGQYD